MPRSLRCQGEAAQVTPPLRVHTKARFDHDREIAAAYRIANVQVLCDRTLALLRGFSVASPAAQSIRTPDWMLSERPPDPAITYKGLGFIADRDRHLYCTAEESGLRIGIQGVGAYAVSRNGLDIGLLGPGSGSSSLAQVNALMGAPLILALAYRGLFCLHVSAVRMAGGLVLFAGESGSGKSTVSRRLAELSPDTVALAADDCLPVRLGRKNCNGLPRFPQLKLPIDEQPGVFLQAQLPIHRLFVLAKAGSDTTRVEYRRLTSRRAAVALASHTISSRLYDRQLMSAHLGFCARAQQSIEVIRVKYPHTPAALQEVCTRVLTEGSSVTFG